MIIENTNVYNIISMDIFDKMPGDYIIIDFSAEWCGPCKKFFPLFCEISNNYKNNKCSFGKKNKVSFGTVNIDNAVGCEELTKGISSVPSFKIYQKQEENNEIKYHLIGTHTGASSKAVFETFLQKYIP